MLAWGHFKSGEVKNDIQFVKDSHIFFIFFIVKDNFTLCNLWGSSDITVHL